MRIESIVRATRFLKLNEDSTRRVRSYFDYIWHRHMDFAGQGLVGELPTQLRKRVSLQMHEAKLRRSRPV